MIIKSFSAESAAAALKKVREELGGEAIVLKTRQLSNNRLGMQVEVTACLEKPSVAATSKALQPSVTASEQQATPTSHNRIEAITANTETNNEIPNGNYRQVSNRLERMEMKLNSLLGVSLRQTGKANIADQLWTVRTQLENADVPTPIAERFMSELYIKVADNEDVSAIAEELLHAKLEKLIDTKLSFKAGDRVMVLGAVAVGKSSLLGKIALKLVADQKLSSTLTTLDDLKIGAQEEVATYADALNLTLANLNNEAVDSSKFKKGVLLIDTPGLQSSTESITAVKNGIEKLTPNYRIAVISALHRASDIKVQLDAIKQYQPTHLAATMLDLTTRYGTILAAAETLNCPIAIITDTPGGMGTMQTPNSSRLISGLLLEEGNDE